MATKPVTLDQVRGWLETEIAKANRKRRDLNYEESPGDARVWWKGYKVACEKTLEFLVGKEK